MNKSLTVYKASAGSGKTFTLAVEYIKLLLENPRAYENILAVTFTNKATEEMKMRILSQLYGLSHGLADSENYMKAIMADTGLTREYVMTQSAKALNLLLHNYHFFRVQTIDTFFQSVLRNLAKELGLNANLRVGLNNVQVVEQAVDKLVDELAEDKNLLSVIVRYMNDRLAEDKSWNVINSVKKFGGAIFNEKYKTNRRRMEEVFADESFFDNYQKELQKIKEETQKKYKDIAQEVFDNIEAAGLDVDSSFSGKSRSTIMGYFKKMLKGDFAVNGIVNDTVEKCKNDVGKWLTKEGMKDDTTVALVEEYLMPKLNEIELWRPDDALRYNTADKTLMHLNDVRLLKRIEASAHDLNEASQRFMLSDTQSLLHEVIDDNDAPFIYEKIGARLDHIMIDEFQDTSTVQWANFKKLLAECMSRGGSNLVVGDVKQSIYRFRSGDWRLLNNIDGQFSADAIDFQPKKTNWRSARGIIKFNNEFFKQAAQVEVQNIEPYSVKWAQDLAKAYADVEQEIPDGLNAGGMVHIELLPKEEADTICERTIQVIYDLQEYHGAKQSDIAILVRGSKEIAKIAKYIEDTEQDVQLVSAEAFVLDASKAVNVIVSAMTLLAHPNDQVARALLWRDTTEEQMLMFEDRQQALASMTLHDMAETLVRIFDIKEMQTEGAYVTKFFDHLHEFSSDMAPSLEDFLTAWQDSIHGENIQTADVDGVRIMTMHKSKGLEFKHVILPFCDWSLNPTRNVTLWLHPDEEPFSRLPMVPVDYKSVSSLMGTYYEKDGIEEHIQNIVDNINLLYVAMTRAGQSLFLIGEKYKIPGNAKKSDKPVLGNRAKLIEDVIKRLPTEIDGVPVHVSGQDQDDDVLMMTYGELTNTAEAKKAKKTENVFSQPSLPVEVPVMSYENKVEYRQSNESRRFADDAVDETDRQRYIRMGTVMHQLFSTIRTLNDVEPVLRRMEFDGLLYDDTLSRDTLLTQLRAKFSDQRVREWFSDKWQVYNECTLLTKDGECRPDRVVTDGKETIVIDFKFGKPHSDHKSQVRDYMNLLEQMGMPCIKGYLWYVTFNDIVSC